MIVISRRCCLVGRVVYCFASVGFNSVGRTDHGVVTNKDYKIGTQYIENVVPPTIGSSDLTNGYHHGKHQPQEKEYTKMASPPKSKMHNISDVGKTSTQCTTNVTLSTIPPTLSTHQSPSSSSLNNLSMLMMMANTVSGSRKWKCSTNPATVRKILKVLRYYSCVLLAMILMVRHPGLLEGFQWHKRRRRIEYELNF